MEIRTRETLDGEIEVKVVDEKNSKRVMKKALVKAFGKNDGEYYFEYGAIWNGANETSIVLNRKMAQDLQRAF